MERANEKLARRADQAFKLLGADWQPGGDQLTPTQNPSASRSLRNMHEIEALYAR